MDLVRYIQARRQTITLLSIYLKTLMINTLTKRKAEDEGSSADKQQKKSAHELEFLRHRPVAKHVLDKLTDEEVDILHNVKSSCTDLELIKRTMKIRLKNRFSVKLQEDMDDADYYIENGLRKVYPYPYIYQASVKRRWIGRKLKEVLQQEFRDITDDQLRKRFDNSRVLVNGDPVKIDYTLRDNDYICNRNHRHELPVLATPIKIIHCDKELLVIDKPPSLPIHPCGRFRHNSVVNLLEREYNITGLKIVHRLDRLVSGVVLIARNSGKANQMENLIKNHLVQKEYVCRVVGEFPLGKPEDDSYITVDEPLEPLPCKIAITVPLSTGKPSVTKFKRLSYNGKTSAVLCKPLTGRMHQIRVHLQYLGHPIVNDILYNCDTFGPERGKGGRYGKSLKQLANDVVVNHNVSTWLISNDGSGLYNHDQPAEEKKLAVDEQKRKEFIDEEERALTLSALNHYFDNESWKDLEEKYKFDEEKFIVDPDCLDCGVKYYDPPLRRLFMCLHALKYSSKDWSYESEMPIWAKDDWPN